MLFRFWTELLFLFFKWLFAYFIFAHSWRLMLFLELLYVIYVRSSCNFRINFLQWSRWFSSFSFQCWGIELAKHALCYGFVFIRAWIFCEWFYYLLPEKFLMLWIWLEFTLFWFIFIISSFSCIYLFSGIKILFGSHILN